MKGIFHLDASGEEVTEILIGLVKIQLFYGFGAWHGVTGRKGDIRDIVFGNET
jgi:hypothetical protein